MTRVTLDATKAYAAEGNRSVRGTSAVVTACETLSWTPRDEVILGERSWKPSPRRSEKSTREAVRLLETRSERTVVDVVASLGVAENLLHSLKKKYGKAAEDLRRERGGETPGEELKRLRRENAQLRQERG